MGKAARLDRFRVCFTGKVSRIITYAECGIFRHVAIVEIGGVPDVANMLGISQATVKTHLQHVFGKTSTTRQAELVKLIADT